jgi:hypothetical protein
LKKKSTDLTPTTSYSRNLNGKSFGSKTKSLR